MFGYDRQTKLVDITDGTASTMLIAETGLVRGSWLQGGSGTVRGLDPSRQPYIDAGRQFGGLHGAGAWVAMADGSVRWIEESISPKIFEALSTMAGGEQLAGKLVKVRAQGVAAGQSDRSVGSDRSDGSDAATPRRSCDTLASRPSQEFSAQRVSASPLRRLFDHRSPRPCQPPPSKTCFLDCSPSKTA